MKPFTRVSFYFYCVFFNLFKNAANVNNNNPRNVQKSQKSGNFNPQCNNITYFNKLLWIFSKQNPTNLPKTNFLV